MNPPLVGLMGYAQSGKDSVASTLVGLGWERIAFADLLRDMLYALNPIIPHGFGNQEGYAFTRRLQRLVDDFGWDEVKVSHPEVRALLQRLGTEAGRNLLGQNFWVEQVEAHIEASDKPYVVSDCRFPNELEMIKRRRGQLVWVERPGTQAVNAHASEHSVSKNDCDYVIVNDGTLVALDFKVEEFAKSFLQGATV